MISALKKLDPILEDVTKHLPDGLKGYLKDIHQPLFGIHPTFEQRISALRG
jgi:hypothetical protein